MKVLVLGAGVVGSTAAWYLAKAGMEVEVLDRQPGPGLETSYANGAQISACHNEPWAEPDTVRKALAWLGKEDAPLFLRWKRWDPALWLWLARLLANANPPMVKVNSDRILRVSLYSRACLQALRKELTLDYDLVPKGILTFFRDSKAYDHACANVAATQSFGLSRRVVSATEALSIEPALAAMGDKLIGGVYSPDDESGDAFKFTEQIAAAAAQCGVKFRYGCDIHHFEWDKDRIGSVATTQGRIKADVFLLAMGSFSPKLARQVGVSLPIYPAKGYSATFTVQDPDKCSTVSLIDEENKVVYSRLGDRLRAAGTAELAGWDASLSKVRSEKLIERTAAQFPGAVKLDEPNLWAGLRPVTPDSVPILGGCHVPNLFLNCGHGMLGWTQAAGSGKILADLISGRPADIDMTGLGVERFRDWWPKGALAR